MNAISRAPVSCWRNTCRPILATGTHYSSRRAPRRRGDTAAALDFVRKFEQAGGKHERAKLEYRFIRIEEGDLTDVDDLAKHAIDRRIPETPLAAEAVAEGCLKALSPEPGTGANYGDNALLLLGHVRHAANVWLELRRGQADQVAGLVWRGRVQCLLGDHANGLPDLKQAMALAPDQFEPRLHYAFFVDMHDTGEALRQFSILRQQKPDDPLVAFALASRYRATGQVDDAQTLLDGLLAVTPADARILLERGLLAMDRSRYAEAELYLLRAEIAAPEKPETSFALSQCMQLRGDPERMKKYREQFERQDEVRRQQRLGMGQKP